MSKFALDNLMFFMSKQGWIIPIVIVVMNAVAILVRWNSLPEMLPAHFDLQGNAGGEMARGTLLLYPFIGAVICGIAYAIAYIFYKRARNKEKAGAIVTGLVFLVSGIALVILSSMLVTLTSGKMPVFMLAEPLFLVTAFVLFIFCIIKARRIQ